MFSRINALKEMGYSPTHIFDIGANHGNWTNNCVEIYPAAHFLMVEAIDYEELNRFRGYTNIDVFNELLNEKSGPVEWYEMRNTGDSMFKEATNYFDNCSKTIKNSITLNECILKSSIRFTPNSSIFIKIDCQGAEIPILKGASEILGMTDFIILEIPVFGQYNQGVPSFLEHIKFMEEIGFIPYDIIERHYINGFNVQVDIMFIKKTHAFNFLIAESLKDIKEEGVI